MENNNLVQENCIFCKIAKNEIETYKIFEDDICIAILDINPASKGHILLFPKNHYPIMQIVPNEVIGHLFTISKMIISLQKEALDCKNVDLYISNGAAAGQQSQHFLIHLIPNYSDEVKFDTNLKDINERDYDNDKLKELSEKLIKKLLEMNKKA